MDNWLLKYRREEFERLVAAYEPWRRFGTCILHFKSTRVRVVSSSVRDANRTLFELSCEHADAHACALLVWMNGGWALDNAPEVGFDANGAPRV